MKWPRGSAWVPRSWAFTVIELGLAWIGGSYGVNLVYEARYRALSTPATVTALSRWVPIPTYGWVMVAGAVLLVLGVALRMPMVSVAGHGMQTMVLVALGIVLFEVNPLNEVSLILGAVLHPVMAVTLARDAGRAEGIAERK
jgi:hypothetical protein